MTNRAREFLRERSEAMTTMLSEPQWKPSRSHVEALRNYMADGAAEIDRLTRDLDLARAEADRLRSYQDTWERTRTSWEKENERLRAALINITKLDQLEKRTCIDFDPAGCTYEIEMIDGPCAHIARRVLEQQSNGTVTK